MEKIKIKLLRNKDVLMVFIIMMMIFGYIMYYTVSDLPLHADIAREKLKENQLFSGNFLMYFVANLLTGFGAFPHVKYVFVLLLALANTAKYALVKDEFGKCYAPKLSQLLSLFLLVVFIIPVLYLLNLVGWVPIEGGYWDYMYCNLMYWYYVPNVWHNSTVLFMMPFAIIAYFLSIRQFETFNYRRNGWITLFVVLGALVKPSFFFIYMGAYFIIMFVRYRFSKEFFCSLVPLIAGCVAVIYVYVSVFSGSTDNMVAISIMPVIEHWKPYLLFFVVSMALPLLFVVFYKKEIAKDMEFWFVLMMLIVAVGIYWCCHETGSRADHGNFWWQTVVAMWFVYYYMLKVIIKNDLPYDTETKTIKLATICWRGKIFMSLYGVHVIMGLIYLAKFFIVRIYY